MTSYATPFYVDYEVMNLLRASKHNTFDNYNNRANGKQNAMFKLLLKNQFFCCVFQYHFTL